MSNILALIPARTGSKGIPNKNFRPIYNGRSPWELAAHCAEQAKIQWMLLTDCHYEPPLPDVLEAGPPLHTDTCAMIDVVKHALANISGPPEQIIVLLQPTQPLRTSAHVQAAITLLEATQMDSVVSVVEVPSHQSPELLCWIGGMSGYLCPYDVQHGLLGGEPRDWSHVPTCRQATGGGFYRRDGTCYAFWRRTVTQYGQLYGARVCPLIIPPAETCALDTLFDWENAERMLRSQNDSASNSRR